jgi:hypothetical protein
MVPFVLPDALFYPPLSDSFIPSFVPLPLTDALFSAPFSPPAVLALSLFFLL